MATLSNSPSRVTPAVEEIPALQPEIPRLLEKVVWGTEGARYQLANIVPTLEHLPNPTYLTLKKDGELIGVRLCLEKDARSNGQPLHCFYHSYFAIDPAFKGQGYGKQLARATIETLGAKLKGKGLIYCHVETDNLRSLRIAESLGYKRVGRFFAITFSRFFPKPSVRLRKLAPSEKALVTQRITNQYAGHALTDFETSLRPESYYVLAEGDRILAGLQAETMHWKILSLAGAGGAIALHALPRIPLLRDLFNPWHFEFLKFGNVFFEKGRPEAAFELFEAVLAQHQKKTAMMFWDKGSPVYQQLAGAGYFGVLNTLTETPIEIMALFPGFKANEIADFASRPKIISPCDL